jgi:hypothetical protein
MTSKKKLVIAVLIIMAIAAGVVFAGELKGVSWYTSDDVTYITNNNDYEVRIIVSREGMGGGISQGLDAGQTKSYDGVRTVTRVTSYNY